MPGTITVTSTGLLVFVKRTKTAHKAVVKAVGRQALSTGGVDAGGQARDAARNCNKQETPSPPMATVASAASFPHPLPLSSTIPAQVQGLFESQLKNKFLKLLTPIRKMMNPSGPVSGLPQENQPVRYPQASALVKGPPPAPLTKPFRFIMKHLIPYVSSFFVYKNI